MSNEYILKICENLKATLGDKFKDFALPQVKWGKPLRDALQKEVNTSGGDWAEIAKGAREQAVADRTLSYYTIKNIMEKKGIKIIIEKISKCFYLKTNPINRKVEVSGIPLATDMVVTCAVGEEYTGGRVDYKGMHRGLPPDIVIKLSQVCLNNVSFFVKDIF